MAAKMTPGPWTVEETDPDRAEVTSRFHCLAVLTDNSPHWKADARAIACLPELVEAARVVLLVDSPTFAAHERAPFAALRRILARIDGETGGDK